MNDDGLNRRLASAGLKLASVVRRVGTETSRLYVVSAAVKASDGNDLSCLRMLKRTMGTKAFHTIFPRFSIIETRDDSSSVLYEIEYLGEENLEQAIFQRYSANRVRELTEQTCETMIVLSSYCGSETKKASVVSEILSSIRNNTEACGLDSCPQEVDVQFVPTLCHRDLSVSNVMTDKKGLRLIDPRLRMPGATIASPQKYGSVAMDCAALYVSLMRKHKELLRMRRSGIESSIHFLERFVSSRIVAGLFDQRFFSLCLAAYYSSYAACCCEYCLAQSRKWLWKSMVNKTVETLSEVKSV